MKHKLRQSGNLKHSKLVFSPYFSRKAFRKSRPYELFSKLSEYKRMPRTSNGEVGSTHFFRYIPILPTRS